MPPINLFIYSAVHLKICNKQEEREKLFTRGKMSTTEKEVRTKVVHNESPLIDKQSERFSPLARQVSCIKRLKVFQLIWFVKLRGHDEEKYFFYS